MDMLRKLSGATWTHWMPHPGHRFLGVRASLQKHAEEQIAEYAWHARCRERPSLSWQSLVTRELRRTICRLHGHGLSCHKPQAIMTVRGTIDISVPPCCRHHKHKPGEEVPYPQRRMLSEVTDGDAALWGDSARRITGSFIACEQREEGTVLLRHATPAMTNIAGQVVPARRHASPSLFSPPARSAVQHAFPRLRCLVPRAAQRRDLPCVRHRGRPWGHARTCRRDLASGKAATPAAQQVDLTRLTRSREKRGGK